uniref:Uncharacterized protein n=1 Tax=Triticum urartu TaxID=4572 RepID=A0A8R7TQT3_TRIUA
MRPTPQPAVQDEDGGDERMSSSSTSKDVGLGSVLAGPSLGFFCDYCISHGVHLPTVADSQATAASTHPTPLLSAWHIGCGWPCWWLGPSWVSPVPSPLNCWSSMRRQQHLRPPSSLATGGC